MCRKSSILCRKPELHRKPRVRSPDKGNTHSPDALQGQARTHCPAPDPAPNPAQVQGIAPWTVRPDNRSCSRRGREFRNGGTGHSSLYQGRVQALLHSDMYRHGQKSPGKCRFRPSDLPAPTRPKRSIFQLHFDSSRRNRE